jgi:hypothetical protein
MKTRLGIAVGAIAWVALVGIAGAQNGIPKGTQINPGKVTPGSGNIIVIGCVSRATGGAANAFIVTDSRPKPPAQYRLDGDADILRLHVGHTVEIGGPVQSTTGTAVGGGMVGTLKVNSLVYISQTCQTIGS